MRGLDDGVVAICANIYTAIANSHNDAVSVAAIVDHEGEQRSLRFEKYICMAKAITQV